MAKQEPLNPPTKVPPLRENPNNPNAPRPLTEQPERRNIPTSTPPAMPPPKKEGKN